MGQIGQRLEQARKSEDLSLEQVQEITKIRLKYLVALEAEDWQVFPGEVYLRGFLKSYAQAVGLDPVDILELYHPTPPSQPEPIPVAHPSVRPAAMRVEHQADKRTGNLSANYGRMDRKAGRSRSRSSLMPAMVLLVLVLVIGGYRGYRAWYPPATVTPPPAPAGTNGTEPTKTPATGANGGNPSPGSSTTTTTAAAVQLTKVSETPFEVRYLVKSVQSLELKIGIKDANPGEAVRECWIDVQSDERNIGDLMLRSGRTQQYTATDVLRIRLGNPQVVDLSMTINGVVVPRPQTTEPVDLIFKRQTE